MDRKKLLLIGGIALVVIIAIILLVVLLGKKNNDGNNTDGTDTGETVVLEYWGLWEPDAVMASIIEAYEADNPNVKIQYTQKSFTQYEENAYTRLKEGSTTGSPAPDILRIHNTWLSKFQPYLYPAPSDVMTVSDFQQTYYTTAVNDFIGTDSQIYAIPLEVDGLAIFYNKELLEAEGYNEPPETWDAIIEAAIELTKKDSGGNITQAGLAMGSSNNIQHSADILSLLMLQNGADLTNDDYTEVNLSDSRAVSSLEFYTDFVLEHQTWSPSLASDLEMFYTGKLAMMIAPSWVAFDIINSNSAVEFDTVPTPILGTSQVYYSHYWGEAVSRNSDHPADAWKFIEYLSEQEQLKELYSNSSQVRAFGEPYSIQNMSSLLDGEPYVDAIMQMAPYFQSWRKGEEAYINEALNTAINQVVESGTDAASALSEAETRINTQLAKTVGASN